MTYNPVNDDTHVRHYCEVHKKHIFFFKKDIAFRGYHCWDCIRDANYPPKEDNKKEESDE